MKTLFTIGCVAMVACACSQRETRLDGSSLETLRVSFSNMQARCSVEQRDKLKDSIVLMFMENCSSPSGDLPSKLDGMTADEVIAYGESLKERQGELFNGFAEAVSSNLKPLYMAHKTAGPGDTSAAPSNRVMDSRTAAPAAVAREVRPPLETNSP